MTKTSTTTSSLSGDDNVVSTISTSLQQRRQRRCLDVAIVVTLWLRCRRRLRRCLATSTSERHRRHYLDADGPDDLAIMHCLTHRPTRRPVVF